MNQPPSPMPLKARLVRRLLPLAILASAIALVVVQLTGSITHEITVQLDLEPRLTTGLTGLDLQVIDQEGKLVSLTQFHFDREHRPAASMTHTLQLVNGSYRLVFELGSDRPTPLVIDRKLEVDGDSAVRFRLP